MRVLSQEEEVTGKKVVDAAFVVHKELGPGLLERVYETCLCYELLERGCTVKRQMDVPVVYRGIVFDEGLQLDVLVNDLVICELKAVDQVNPLDGTTVEPVEAEGKRLGYLINFNVPLIKDGIKRVIL